MLLSVGLGFVFWVFLLFFQSTGIYGGDSGDLVTASYLGGVPHPPGYPLYTFLGFLLSRLPVSTPAWRVGLLSSLSSAATLVLLFLIVLRLTKNRIFAFFAVLLLLGNYLFFLYSVTPEVFSLLVFFVALLTYLTLSSHASFVLGLALAHHHMALFLIPSILWAKKKLSMGFLLLGVLAYLYIPLAARGRAIINWDNASGLQNFIRLVTRADYGTFVSSGFYGNSLRERLLAIKTYGQFLLIDFTWVGFVLSVFGLVWLKKKNPQFFTFTVLAFLLLGPLFFFYASFPLVNRFTIGTYERFLLPSYFFLVFVMALGFTELLSWAKNRVVRATLLVGMFFYPIFLLTSTVLKFQGMRTDRTADSLGRDILSSVPKDGILFLSHDTPLFTTQYVRYALHERQDVVALHAGRMAHADYPEVLRKVFPGLSLPPTHSDDYLLDFLRLHAGTIPIASNARTPVPEGFVWVPRGLVFTLEKNAPTIETLLSENETLWNTYQNPSGGILGKYNHLMLSDIRNVYANARFEFGKILLSAGKLASAKVQFEAALRYEGETQESEILTYLGLSELFVKNCKAARIAFSRARQVALIPEPRLLLFEGFTARDCEGDNERARVLLKTYEDERKKQETLLEGW